MSIHFQVSINSLFRLFNNRAYIQIQTHTHTHTHTHTQTNTHTHIHTYIWGRRVIGISGSLIWSKTMMELIFNLSGEFWWSPEGPVSQIHSPHLHAVSLGSFQIFKVCSDARVSGVWKATGSYRTYSSLVKLQPWFLSLRRKTCLRQNCSLDSCACSKRPALGQNTDLKLYIYIYIYLFIGCFTNYISRHYVKYIT